MCYWMNLSFSCIEGSNTIGQSVKLDTGSQVLKFCDFHRDTVQKPKRNSVLAFVPCKDSISTDGIVFVPLFLSNILAGIQIGVGLKNLGYGNMIK